MCRKIVITSGKGGVGKTTITASLGASLAEMGYKVLLVDADIGLNNLDVVMGIDHKVTYDMADVLEGKCRIKQALIKSESFENLYVLPSAHAYSSDDVGVKSFRQLIARMENVFDFIIIDCPAGIDKGFHRAVLPADEAIVVTTPHIPSIKDADKVLALLGSYNLNGIRLIVNRIRGDLVLKGDVMSGMEIAKLLRRSPVGFVPEDDGITVYSQLGKLGSAYCRSKESFDMIADNLISGKRRLYDCSARYRGVFGKLKMRMRKEA